MSDGEAVRGLTVELDSGERSDIGCDVLVDASGQRTFLAGLGLSGSKRRGKYDNQVAIYSHFAGAIRDPGDQWGNTVMFFREKNQWAWMIPLDEETTSIGFVVPSKYFQSRSESMADFLTRELHTFNRELARRVERVERVEDVRSTSNYSYQVERFSGKGWLCIGDAHRFIDPLFSFGVNIAMAEGRQAAREIGRYLNGERDHSDRPFLDFEMWSNNGVDVCQAVLDGFWDKTFVFGLLVHRYPEDFIDLLGGRVWDGANYRALELIKDSLAGDGNLQSADDVRW
jgi:flavin-dependent dehydrogenase